MLSQNLSRRSALLSQYEYATLANKFYREFKRCKGKRFNWPSSPIVLPKHMKILLVQKSLRYGKNDFPNIERGLAYTNIGT